MGGRIGQAPHVQPRAGGSQQDYHEDGQYPEAHGAVGRPMLLVGPGSRAKRGLHGHERDLSDDCFDAWMHRALQHDDTLMH